jgi:hypothetical protein
MQVDEEKKEIRIELYNNQDKKYCFVIDEHYPFRPPKKFNCNNVPYIEILRIPSQKFYNELKTINGKECFCCHSITCPNNWGPAHQLALIIKESKEFIRIKQAIIEKIVAKHIVEKYLVSDITSILNQYIY